MHLRRLPNELALLTIVVRGVEVVYMGESLERGLLIVLWSALAVYAVAFAAALILNQVAKEQAERLERPVSDVDEEKTQPAATDAIAAAG